MKREKLLKIIRSLVLVSLHCSFHLFSVIFYASSTIFIFFLSIFHVAQPSKKFSQLSRLVWKGIFWIREFRVKISSRNKATKNPSDTGNSEHFQKFLQWPVPLCRNRITLSEQVKLFSSEVRKWELEKFFDSLHIAKRLIELSQIKFPFSFFTWKLVRVKNIEETYTYPSSTISGSFSCQFTRKSNFPLINFPQSTSHHANHLKINKISTHKCWVKSLSQRSTLLNKRRDDDERDDESRKRRESLGERHRKKLASRYYVAHTHEGMFILHSSLLSAVGLADSAWWFNFSPSVDFNASPHDFLGEIWRG